MANYSLTYQLNFQDQLLSNWRIDFSLKDGPIASEPIQLIGSGTPLSMERKNRNENKFEPIITTITTIEYIYRGDSDPVPETFIDIDNDTWLISVYQDGSLNWKGFLTSDNNSFPWVPAPFAFSLSATDFAFMDSTVIDLNDVNKFLYDYVTIGDMLNRTLFHATGYDSPVLHILYSKKPTVIGAGLITNKLYIHTDAFYDFIDGPMFITDCLTAFLRDIGARIFYDNGAYWMQFIEDIALPVQSIITITPTDLVGTISDNFDTAVVISNLPGAELIYTNRSQNRLISRPLKQQIFNYTLKGINKLLNFDWRDFDGNKYTSWTRFISNLVLTRSGSGSIGDPYHNIMSGGGNTDTGDFIGQTVIVHPGERVELNVKAYVYWSQGVYMDIGLQPFGGIGNTYTLDSSGRWVEAPSPVAPEDRKLLTGSKTNRLGTLQIVSDVIPSGGAVSYTLFFNIIGPVPADDPNDPLPPGEYVRNEILPVFLRLFDSSYIKYRETVANQRRYSYVADPAEGFFMDGAGSSLSNTIYYDVAGVKTALPRGNWSGKSIDEISVVQHANEQNKPTNSVMGEFRGNTLKFYQSAILYDLGGVSCIQIRDSYDVRKCIHKLMVTEIIGDADHTYTYSTVPLTKDTD